MPICYRHRRCELLERNLMEFFPHVCRQLKLRIVNLCDDCCYQSRKTSQGDRQNYSCGGRRNSRKRRPSNRFRCHKSPNMTANCERNNGVAAYRRGPPIALLASQFIFALYAFLYTYDIVILLRYLYFCLHVRGLRTHEPLHAQFGCALYLGFLFSNCAGLILCSSLKK